MIGGDINGGDIIGGKKFILNWHSYDPFVTSTRGQKEIKNIILTPHPLIISGGADIRLSEPNQTIFGSSESDFSRSNIYPTLSVSDF